MRRSQSHNYHGANFRESTVLTEKLIEEISKSISTFKPSASLAQIAHEQNETPLDDGYSLDDSHFTRPPHAEIDVVISGGALKGYYMAGAALILTKELKKRNISINRVAGASAGAWAGMFLVCGLRLGPWLETYYFLQDRPKATILEIYEEIAPWVFEFLPENAYELCNDRLFISITVITLTGPKNKIISQYKSNRHLLECCMASSTIPFLTERNGFRRLDGDLVLDGGVTNNCPVFTDGIRRQLVFRLFEVEYPNRFILSPKDSCIDLLVLRGALLMARFLQGHRDVSISWLEKKEKKEKLYLRPNYLLRSMIIAPVTVFGVMAFRGLGFRDLMEMIKGGWGPDSVPLIGSEGIVPFSEALRFFQAGANPFEYLFMTTLAAGLDLLRSFNLLL